MQSRNNLPVFLVRGSFSLVSGLRRVIQHLHLSRKTKDNRLERSRGGVRLPRRAVPVAVDVDWSDTGYWSRLTPNPGNSLAFIVGNCCVGGELVQHNAAPARGGLIVSSRCTRARNRVLHASLVEPGGCTVGAEFCAERQTIAAKWLNCSQLNKCSSRICPPEYGAKERRARFFSYAPLFFPPLTSRDSFLSLSLLYTYIVLVPHVSSLLRRERTYRYRSQRGSSEEEDCSIPLFLSRLLCVPAYERMRARESRRGSRSLR